MAWHSANTTTVLQLRSCRFSTLHTSHAESSLHLSPCPCTSHYVTVTSPVSLYTIGHHVTGLLLKANPSHSITSAVPSSVPL